jgi:hypothetical protein
MTWDRTIEPSEEDLHRAHIEHALRQVHTAMPCRVQSYDPALQVADLVPLVRCAVHDPDGGITHEDYPVLPCVPVVFPRTSDHFIAFAIQPGDMGVALFCEDAIGHWRVGGGDVTDPGFLGRHHLGAGVFIPGLFDRSKKLANAPAFASTPGSPRLVIGSDDTAGTRVAFNNNGSLKITQGSTVVFQLDADGVNNIGGAAGQAIATAQAVTSVLDSLKSAIAAWTPVPNDGGASLKAVISGWSASVTGATKAKAT